MVRLKALRRARISVRYKSTISCDNSFLGDAPHATLQLIFMEIESVVHQLDGVLVSIRPKTHSRQKSRKCGEGILPKSRYRNDDGRESRAGRSRDDV